MRVGSLGSVLCGLLLGVATAWAAPGDYDFPFGDKGIVRAPFQTRAFGQAISRQPDGKLLAAGVVHPAQGYEQVALVRLQPDGTLDASFGTGGAALATVGNGSGTPQARSILVEDDGKVVVVGSLNSIGDDGIFLVRYDAQGSLDPGFGNGGIVVTTPPGAQLATDAVLQPDGKVVVATSAAGDVRVLRYGTDGALDPSFGTGGIATLDFAGLVDRAAAIASDPGGGVLVLGAAVDPGNASYVALGRLDDAGALDPTFGNGGTILHDIGSAAPPVSLVRLGDGKLLVSAGGYVGNPGQFTGAYLLRLDATGALDPTFGAGGVLADASEYSILALVPTSDGKLVGISTTGYALVIQRFEADGSLDPTFGDDGEVETQIGLGGYPGDAIVEPDGKVNVTGVEYAPCEAMNCDLDYDIAYRFFLVRFQGGTAPCSSDGDCGACESCGAAGACVFGPRASCTHAQFGGAKIAIGYDAVSGDLDRYRIRLKWRGDTPLGFDPLTTDDVGMCLYLEGRRVLRAVAPAGGLCAGSPCWKSHAGSFGYRDRDRSPDGIAQLKLKSAIASVDASGANLATAMHGVLVPGSPDLLSQSSILAQVHAGNGQCLQATLSDFELSLKPFAPGSFAIVGLRAVGQ